MKFLFKNFKILSLENGFTLLELLAALLILTLVIFAFTPLFLSSIERIHFAGDKSEALFQSQSEIEISIAERQTVDGYELVFTYGENEIIVPGGLVDVEVAEGRATASLGGFVPFVPTINFHLQLLPLFEGYNELPMLLLGKDTQFELVGEPRKLQIYDSAGVLKNEPEFTIIVPPDGVPEGYTSIPERYEQYARFDMPGELRNEGSPYLAEISWMIESDIEIVVRARFQVMLPQAVAVGSGQRLWNSPDALGIWKQRYQGTGDGSIQDVVWTGYEYVAVASTGRIIFWRNRLPLNTDVAIDVNPESISYGGGTLVVVGQNGKVIYSKDAHVWSLPLVISDQHLNAVGYSDAVGQFVAVGNNGVIFSSADGMYWDDEWAGAAPAGVTFKGVAYGNNRWLAVGQDSGGAVIYKSTVDGWEKVEHATLGSITHILNDLLYDGTQFIVVGEGGVILTSIDGDNWTTAASGTVNNLNAIDWSCEREGNELYVIVGDGGTVLTWTGEVTDSWIIQISGFSSNVYGVAVR